MHSTKYKDLNVMRHRHYGHRVGDLVTSSWLPKDSVGEVVEYGFLDNNRLHVLCDCDGEIRDITAESCVTHVKIEDRLIVHEMQGAVVLNSGFFTWDDICKRFDCYRDMNESTEGVTSGFATILRNGWTVVAGGGSRGGIDFNEVTVFNATGVVLYHEEREV